MRATSGRVVWGISLGATVAMAGCAAPERAGEWSGIERDSAGVMIVENPATALWREGEPWHAESTLEIGLEAGDAAYEFGNIRGIGQLSGNRIAVLDGQTAQVRLFGPDGVAAGSFGRRGSGPGELSQYADALWTEPGDTVVVVDMGNRAILRYTAEGAFARAVRMPMESGITYYWTGDGRGLSYHNARSFAGQRADSVERLEVRTADGAHVRTVATYPARESMAGDRTGVRLTLFSPEVRWAVGDSGAVWVGETHAYRIRRYDAHGRIDRIVTMPFTPREVREADRGVYVDAMVRLWEGRVSPAMRPHLRSATTFHSTFPVFVSLRGGPEGTLWVQPFRGPDEMTLAERATLDAERDLGSPDWHVFDRRGRWLGSVRFPPRFTPYVLSAETILGVTRDANNVQRVVRLRLRRGGVP